MKVKTFDKKKLHKLLKESDPYITDYLEAVYRIMEMQRETINKALAKIRELSIKEDSNV